MTVSNFWCCKNQDCKMKNAVNRAQIDEAIQKGSKIVLVCANCGVAGTSVKNGTVFGSDFLETVPFEEWESRQPVGKGPDSTYIDSQGRPLSRNEFLMKYGIDPEINWNWRHAGKPKPLQKC